MENGGDEKWQRGERGSDGGRGSSRSGRGGGGGGDDRASRGRPINTIEEVRSSVNVPWNSSSTIPKFSWVKFITLLFINILYNIAV